MELVPFSGHFSTSEIRSHDTKSQFLMMLAHVGLSGTSDPTYMCCSDTHNQVKLTLRLSAAGIILPLLVLDYSAHRLLIIKITFNYCEAEKID